MAPEAGGSVEPEGRESVIQAKGPLVERLEMRKLGGSVWPP